MNLLAQKESYSQNSKTPYLMLKIEKKKILIQAHVVFISALEVF